MSYILDALRRAERERRAGKSPGMESLTEGMAEAAARLPLGIWVLAVLTLLLAAAALVLSLRHHPQAAATASVAAAPVAAAPIPAAAMPATPAPTLTQEPALLEDTLSVPTIANGEALSNLDDLSADEDSAVSSGAATLITPGKRSARAAGSQIENSPAPRETAATASSEKPAVVDSQQVPRLVDMPESYRAQFPSISLDVHFYDADAARSWIMIDGQRYKEGDSLPGGPRIVRIVDTGVIYDYAGQMVLVQNR